MHGTFAMGLLSLLVVVMIWALSSFLTRYLEIALHFKAIFMFSYISSSMLSLNFIYWFATRYWGCGDSNPYKEIEAVLEDVSIITITRSNKNNNSYTNLDNMEMKFDTDSSDQHSIDISTSPTSPTSATATTTTELPPLLLVGSNVTFDIMEDKAAVSLFQWIFQPIPENYSHKDLVYTATLLMPFWFMCHFFYSYSLLYTSIDSALVIFSVSGAATLIFSVLLGIETITMYSVVGVIFSFIGVALISWGDKNISNKSSQGRGVFFGDIMAFLSAMFGGIYTTFIKLKVPIRPKSSKSIPMSLLFGYFGLVACISFFPIIFYIFAFHADSIKDLTPFVFAYIAIEELFDGVIATMLYAHAAILTSPTIAAVGVNMTAPFAIIIDFFYEGVVPTIWQVIGAMFSIAGMFILCLS